MTKRESLIAAHDEAKCPTCDGRGSIEVPHPSGWEEYGTVYAECPACKGSGVKR